MQPFPEKRFLEAGIPAEQVAFIYADFELRSQSEKDSLLEQWAGVDADGLRKYAEATDVDALAERFADMEAEVEAGKAPEDMTKAELKAQLGARGIELEGNPNRDALIESLNAQLVIEQGGEPVTA